MSQHAASGLPRADVRPRTLLLDVVALLLFVVAIVAAYFRMPAGEVQVANILQAGLLVSVAVGLLLFFQMRSLRKVSSSRAPLLRALGSVVVFFASYLVIFAYVYLSLEATMPGQVPGVTTHVDGLYFTVTMITTVGFGDLAPAGQAARAVSTVQMLVNLVLLGLVVRLSVKVGRDAAEARHTSSPGEDDRGHRGRV
jgi:voltage-gated potassium channel